jgi:hypothetical protein
MDIKAIKNACRSLGKLLVPSSFRSDDEINAKVLSNMAHKVYKTETPEQRYQNYLKSVLKDAKDTARYGHVYKVATIPEDLDEFVTTFIKDLTDKGFLIVNLQVVEPSIERPHIFIYWGLKDGGTEE